MELIIQNDDNYFMTTYADRSKRHRLKKYLTWMASSGHSWWQCNLAAYRDYLLHEQGLAAASVTNHLATMRSRYHEILRDNGFRQKMYASLPDEMGSADKKAHVDEITIQIRNGIDPHNVKVKQIKKQDVADSEHRRLTIKQANDLLSAPLAVNGNNLRGLRDTAIISLFLCTGIRVAELYIICYLIQFTTKHKATKCKGCLL